MSLSPGPETFTLGRLRKVWREGRHVPGRFRRPRYEYFEWDHGSGLKYPERFCLGLHASVQDPVSHISRIDETFAPLLEGRFNATVSEDAVRILST